MSEQLSAGVTGAAPPVTLGRYTLLAQLAVGGMAEIYLARQQGVGGFEKIVVVKKILDSYAADEGFVTMFLDEARIAAQLNHPNVVQIFDLGQADRTYFIAMEYLAGESVSRLVRRSSERGTPLPYYLGAQIIAQAADGLHYAHTASDSGGRPLHIVHRDISPQNLVVTYGGVVKVVDFGIALAANRASQTEQGKVKGKLNYMSPEQARGLELDARSDVFALGIVLYEVLTGRRMFKQDDPVNIFGQILNGIPLPRASATNPQIPFELDEIVAAALRKNRNERYQSAKELHDALTDWLRHADFDRQVTLAGVMGDLFAVERERRLKVLDQAAKGEEISSGGITGPGTERSMPGGSQPDALPPPSSNRVAIGAGVALGLVVFGLGGYFGLRNPPPAAPAGSTTLAIAASPREAHVVVDGADRGTSPIQIADLPLGAHTVVLRMDGRPDLTRTVQLDRPGQSVDLTLEMPPAPAAVPAPPPPAPAPPPPPVAVVPPPPVAAAPSAPVPAPVAPAPERPARSEKRARSKEAPAGGSGTLNLDCAPWAEVTVDGKAMGETPLIGVALPAGSHSIHLVNPDRGLQQTITVTITAGQTTAKKVKL